MTREQQDKLWNELSEESKKLVLKNYQDYNNDLDDGVEKWIKREYNALFGSHNLNPKPKAPKTWSEVEKSGIEIPTILSEELSYKIIKKNEACTKIAKLIALGYGGMVTEEEWKDDNIKKYCVIIDNGEIDNAADFIVIKQFIAFHTPEQREEFMSYPENVELIRQYHLL